MCTQLTLSILIFLCFEFTEGADTRCVDSQKHFANLCFTPKPFAGVDWEWSSKSQPSDGWHSVLGNDIARLHFAEVFRGKSLSLTDNYDDFCFRSSILHSENPKDGFDGQYYAFGNLTSKWNCNNSADFPGVLLCDEITSAPTKYHENYYFYISYSDNRNVQIAVLCFPNGQVGWISISISKSLTDAEKKIVTDHATSLGFSEDTTVTTYDEGKCPNE